MNIPVSATDERAIVHQGAQLAIDITLRSALTTTGEPCAGGATVNGATLQAARQQKEAKYRELLEGHRCSLIVVGVETGGRFGQEAVDFVDLLAKAKARDSPRILHRSVQLGVGCGCWPSPVLARSRFRWCQAATHGQALTVVCQIWLICFTGFLRVVLPSPFSPKKMALPSLGFHPSCSRKSFATSCFN